MLSLKISKNTLLLGGAVALGVLCFVGAQYYLRTYLTQAESKLAGSYAKKKVLVAAVEIPAGGTLSSENLAVRSIPERYLSSTALEPDALDSVSGQKVMVALKPGDTIDRGSLEHGERAALSTTVAKGERAITFPVDEISSISGMLVPGDIIDLLFLGSGKTVNSYLLPSKLTVEANTEPKDLMHVRVLLQAVAVMATGKTTQKRIVKSQNGEQQEVNVDFSTVTLNVSPEQAQQILIAQKLGQLTAVLRNPDDTASLGKMVLDETTFKTVDAAPRLGSGQAGEYVEMIIGGSGAPSKSRAEVGKELIASLLGINQPPKANEKLAPNASDVKARLGLIGSSSSQAK